jgi:hypothetical protein
MGSGPLSSQPHRITLSIKTGIVLVGSDSHLWPGPLSTAMRGFIRFCKKLKPRAVVLNGDVLDCATISRHAPIGWENRPTVQEEISAGQQALAKIERAAPQSVLVWLAGNHCIRYETRLATVAPEFARVHGIHLKDHFNPRWRCAWSLFINNEVAIKHRFRSGVHGVYNNTMHAGMTMLTGHDHALRISPFTDYRATRWGVSTGCLADVKHQSFVDYGEDAPRNWRSGFVVLTFRDKKLLWPEIVSVFDETHLEFRGQLVEV